MLKIGSLLDNKYRILNEIGHGGMSVVYLAINERANKTWAVKEVRKDGVLDFESVKQGLVVETEMLKRLNHPHLPSIIDVIDMADSFIIVMDYIEGRSLQSLLKEKGAQSVEQVIEWGIQLCDVLGYLHSRQPAIIYRDMKPANVMLRPDNTVALIDFGTAREFKNRAMVEDTTCLGTRGYAAPEQFGGRGQTDARTDIYCLGATLYHLLTGHNPAEPPFEIKPLRFWNPLLADSGIEYIINKCTQQDPEARYQTCAELMYDLEHWQDINPGVIISRKRKWRAFLASAIACAVGVAGMVGFGLAKNSATKATYNYYIEEASRNGANFDEAVRNIKLAMKNSPTRPEAYDALLDLIEMDGQLSNDESRAIIECLGESSGKKKNEDALADSDPSSYAEVEFRIGKLFFLMSDNSTNAVSQSMHYLERAVQSGKLAGSDKSLAEALYEVAKNPNGISGGMYTNSEFTADDLWTVLHLLTDAESNKAVGRNAFRIALYNKAVNLINQNYKDMNGAAVTENGATKVLSLDDILAMVVKVENELTALQSELSNQETVQGVGERLANALVGAKNTENQIRSYQEKLERG